MGSHSLNLSNFCSAPPLTCVSSSTSHDVALTKVGADKDDGALSFPSVMCCIWKEGPPADHRTSETLDWVPEQGG